MSRFLLYSSWHLLDLLIIYHYKRSTAVITPFSLNVLLAAYSPGVTSVVHRLQLTGLYEQVLFKCLILYYKVFL